MTTDVGPRERESVDEVIDRVAAAMTAVPGDAEFATRLAGRLPARRASWLEPRGLVGAALAVAVVVLAVSMTIRRGDPHPQMASDGRRQDARPQMASDGRHPQMASDGRRRLIGGATVGPASQPPITAEATVATTLTRDAQSPARPRRTYISHDHVVPQIAALSAPAALGVGDVDPILLTITPVELAPLDLANLTFSDLDSPDHPKE